MTKLPAALVLATAAWLASPSFASAAPYRYHGALMDGEVPAQGAYDLRVRSFAQPGDAKPLGDTTELSAVPLVDGHFSVALDLPEDADGTTWVEVAVRRAGSADDYETLGDPQPLAKANSTCPGAWALDGNSGIPAGSFLGIAETGTTPLVLKANNTTVATFTPRGLADFHGDAPSVALGSASNVAAGIGATVAGGGASKSNTGDSCPTCRNAAMWPFSTVGGGLANRADNERATIGGGYGNLAGGSSSTVAGGLFNQATAWKSAIGGGGYHLASGEGSTIGGGESNAASGRFGTVPGGANNCVGGHYGWAGGQRAKVRSATGATGAALCGTSSDDADGDEGSFVWADSGAADFVSSGPNQFLIRAAGGVAINANQLDSAADLLVAARPSGSGADADADLELRSRGARSAAIYLTDSEGILVLSARNVAGDTRFSLGNPSPVTGRYLQTNANGAYLSSGGTWTNGSSRAFKHAFEAIDVSDVLARVIALPLSRWRYRDSSEGAHLGPMAEDFAAAFGLGGSVQHISTVDADGVALAAIQGLNTKLEVENAAIRSQNAALRAQLDAIAVRLARLERRAGE